jgi:SAM-dependent methyltransferase
VDASVLAARPLLDVGTGDAQTLLALTDHVGLRVGVDRSFEALRAAKRSGLRDVVVAEAGRLPLRVASLRTILAGDVFHHLDDGQLTAVLAELRRVARPDGLLVAWWYEAAGRGGPGDPRYPRSFHAVARLASAAGFAEVSRLELEAVLETSPPTVGLRAGA